MFPLYIPQYIGLPPLKPSFTMDFPMIVENHHDITIKITTKYIIVPLYILIPNIFLIHTFHTGFPQGSSHEFPIPRAQSTSPGSPRCPGRLLPHAARPAPADRWLRWAPRPSPGTDGHGWFDWEKWWKWWLFVGKSREKDGFYGTFHGKIHGKWWRDGNCMRSMENDAFWCWFCGDVLEFLVGISMEISWNIMRILTIKL